MINAIGLRLSHYRVNWSGNERAQSRKQALTLKLNGIKTTTDCFMSFCVNLYYHSAEQTVSVRPRPLLERMTSKA